jgi:acyl-CoA thioester hydrolase
MRDQRAFTWPVRVYWEDTDAGGIVFYANYLKYFERARTEWLRSLGVEQRALRESSGGMFIVTQTTMRYLQPARLDDELLVTATLQESGRASLIIAQHALPSHGGDILCQGTIRIGWVQEAGAPAAVDAATAAALRPARIPAVILQALETTQQ